MNSDMDHGGTDTDAVTHCCIDNSSDKSSAGTYDMVDNSAGYRIESIEHDKLASLHNPNYTDTFSSVGSDVPLLAKDKNKIWEESEEDIPGSTRYKYNPEESDADRLENQTSSRLLPDVQNDDDENDYLKINIQKYFDESQGKNKEFNVSVVEIVPHISHDTDDPPWESTAYIDEYSCASPSTRRLERVCKNAMLSLSQDLSCKSSMKGSTILPVIINQISDQPKVQIEEAESFFEGNEIKNLLVMSISVALMNAAFSSLRNLQSSLNHEGGIGLYSLTGSCGAFTLLSIFTPSLIQQFRPKKCFLIALCTHLLFVAANVVPEFYIMVPASILQGAGAAVLWNAISTYITYLARSNAIRNDKRTVHIASKYFGIFFCFFQLSVVVGNMISSVVLFRDTKVSESTMSKNESGIIPYLSNENSTLELDSHESGSICGAKYCHSYKIEHETVNVESDARYNLLGIYGVATVLSLVLPMLLMDHLKNYRTTRVSLKRLTHQATAVLRCILDVRFLSCFIIFLYSNMELGFVMAEITKAFITCPLGIHMVGYTMICFGLCGSISSFIGGRIEKYVGNVTLISIATIIHLVLLAVLLTWVPDPNQLYMFFIILGAWGVGDGIWISQVNCVVSSLFPDQLEEAFASLRVVNGLGMTIGFAYSSSLCMSYKMYILFAVCLSGTVVYVASEIVRRYRADKVAKEVDDEDKY